MRYSRIYTMVEVEIRKTVLAEKSTVTNDLFAAATEHKFCWQHFILEDQLQGHHLLHICCYGNQRMLVNRLYC